MALVDSVPWLPLSLLAFCLNLSLSLASLLLHLFSILVLVHGHRYFSQKFFYIVGRHLLAADLLSTTAQLLIAVPVSIMSIETSRVYLRTSFAQFVLTLETLAHLDSFHFVALQSCAFLPCFRSERMAYHLHSYGTIVGVCVWMWVAGLMLLFGFTPCAKRFDPASLYFYDICYWPHDPKGGSLAPLNIWLTVLLLATLFVYTNGLYGVQRRIGLICSPKMHFRRGSISISVVMPSVAMPSTSVPPSPMVSTSGRQQLSPRSQEIAERKRRTEMFRFREMITQGFLITVSLTLRFIGFFALPWASTALFGHGVDSLNGRTLLNVLGNTLILLSLISHPIIYCWWNLRIRALAKEVAGLVEEKILRRHH